VFDLKTAGKFGVIVLILAALVTVGYIYGDYVTKTTEISDENMIFEKIDYDIKTIERFSWMRSHYEIAIANPENFKKSAANGTVEMRLLGNDFDVKLQEKSVFSNPEMYPHIKNYQGKVVGIPDSSALFTVANDVVLGHIDTGSEYYSIEQTNKRYDGKVVHVIYSSDASRDAYLRNKISSLESVLVELRPGFQIGELNFTVMPEKTTVLDNETFPIHLTLTNVGENTINVWGMYEQISYDVYFYDSNGTQVPYGCGVISRTTLTNEDLVELSPGQSLNATFDSKCWNLNNGTYTLNAVYHTSRGESITKPYWIGTLESNNITIGVVKENVQSLKITEQTNDVFEGITIEVSGCLPYMSHEDLSNESDVILMGNIKEILPSKWNTPDGERPTDVIEDLDHNDLIYTDIVVNVDQYLKNPFSEKEVIVRTIGGNDGYICMSVNYEPSFKTDEKVLLYLRDDTYAATHDVGFEHFVVTGGMQGKFTLNDDGKAIGWSETVSLEELLETI
jgi:hypothetical protein